MMYRIRLLAAISLAVILLAPMAYSAHAIGKIQLFEATPTGFDAEPGQFGTQAFGRFTFVEPQSFYLCDFGLDPSTPTGCKDNHAGDLITISNIKGGPTQDDVGVVAIISDLETAGPPAGFPMPPEGSPKTPLIEVAKQRLPATGVLATLDVDGHPGPNIRLTVKSDIDPPNATSSSDVLLVFEE